VSAAQAGFGEAQIKATVTAKSCPGQVRKHYIWYGLTPDRARLNTQCSICLQIGWGSDEGGEKRESHTSLTQVKGKDNAAEASGGMCGADTLVRCVGPRALVLGRPPCRISIRALFGLDGSLRLRSRRAPPSPHSSCRLLLAQLLEEQADRFDSTIEIRNMEFFVRGVQIVVGQSEAHHHRRNL
jgi:hypothetical protein